LDANKASSWQRTMQFRPFMPKAVVIVELERLTIRAPIVSTVLQVNAKVGELAAPQPLMSLGDLSAQRVRAELDERDVGKIKLGDNVAVRADAFRGREFVMRSGDDTADGRLMVDVLWRTTSRRQTTLLQNSHQ
jgi:multidrug efflux pump subunit AcrA (membrane-fusion protein)